MKNELGYEVVRHRPVCDCGKRGDHNERYDAYFCWDCNKWLESGCDDPECSFCKNRPWKPKQGGLVKSESDLKTRYKHIHFVKIADKPKTSVWSCRNNSSLGELGEISWYPSWRQYCFFPIIEGVYSVSCFEDINHFMRQLRNEK